MTKLSKSDYLKKIIWGWQVNNPFIYGQEVSGKIFCNRSKEIKELLSDIRSGQNVIIPRKSVKTHKIYV